MKHSILLAAGGAAAVCLAAVMPRMWKRPKGMTQKYYAHRGLHENGTEAPENTLPAFQKAVEAGYGIELDVQLSRDGQVVVFHDFDLKRAAGMDVQVDSLPFDALREIKLFGSGQRMPLLQEVLELVNKKVPLIVEIKYKHGAGGICEAAQRLLDDYEGEYCIESFHPQALLWYRKYRPRIVRGQLAMRARDVDENPWLALAAEHLLANWATKPDFIAYDIRAQKGLAKNICRKLFHCPSVAWTVRNEKELEAARAYYDSFIFEGFLPEGRSTKYESGIYDDDPVSAGGGRAFLCGTGACQISGAGGRAGSPSLEAAGGQSIFEADFSGSEKRYSTAVTG